MQQAHCLAAGIDQKRFVQVSLVTIGASSGTGNDNRTLGEQAKDAWAGRSSSTTGHSTGQGYTQEGHTPGTGKSMDACLAGSAPDASAQLYWLQLASVLVTLLGSGWSVTWISVSAEDPAHF